jgi:hypothetical protein
MDRKQTETIHVRFSPDEIRMIDAYCSAVDRHKSGLVRHALWSMMRRDKRRVPQEFHDIIGASDE